MTVHAPRDEAESAAIIAEAAGRRTPLAVAGAGTKAAMGRPAQTEATLSSSGSPRTTTLVCGKPSSRARSSPWSRVR